MYLVVVLIYISLMANDVKHLFVSLFAICIIFLGEVSIQTFCHLGGVVYLLSEF